MNGTRTNQLDAPTSFITSISRRRANVARRIVFTMRNSEANSSARKIVRKPTRIQRLVVSRSFTAFSAVWIWSTPGRFRYCAAICLVSEAFRGATRNDSGRSAGRDRVDQLGPVPTLVALEVGVRVLVAQVLEAADVGVGS